MQLTMEPLEEMLASARVMDEAGLDTVWLAEAYPWWRKHGMEARSSTVASALIAQATERLTVGWGGDGARRAPGLPRGNRGQDAGPRRRDRRRLPGSVDHHSRLRPLPPAERRRRHRQRLHRRRLDRRRPRGRPRGRARDRGHVP